MWRRPTAALLIAVACGARSELDGAPPIDASLEDDYVVEASVHDVTPEVAPDVVVEAATDACAFDGGTLASQTQLSLGLHHGCAAVSGGSVKCFGRNDYGQLGNGTTDVQTTSSATAVVGLSNVASVAAGDRHTCALLTDGSVKCWGANEGGQVTPVLSDAVTTPMSPGTLNAPVVQLIAGSSFTCARLACDGGVECWGLALGTTFATPKLVPQLASAIDLTTSIDGNTVQVLARDVAGSTWCWEVGTLTFAADCFSPKSTDIGLSNDIVQTAFLSLYPEKGAEPCVVTSKQELRCEPGHFPAADAGGFTLPMEGVSHVAMSGYAGVGICWLFSSGVAQCWHDENYGVQTIATGAIDVVAGGSSALAVYPSGQVGYGGGFINGIP